MKQALEVSKRMFVKTSTVIIVAVITVLIILSYTASTLCDGSCQFAEHFVYHFGSKGLEELKPCTRL